MYAATARTVILGPDEPEPPDRIVVRLHPTGTKAKGIGYEKETRAAIEWLEEHVQPGMTVCDVGTGTGILAIVAARLGAKEVIAYERWAPVRKIADANVSLNGLTDTILVLGAFEDREVGGFDLVVANLGDVDYEGMGILAAGKAVWTTNDA